MLSWFPSALIAGLFLIGWWRCRVVLARIRRELDAARLELEQLRAAQATAQASARLFAASSASSTPFSSASTNTVLSPLESVPGARILITDDNEVNLRVAQVTLKRLGYSTALALDGAEAVAAHEREGFEIILMDVQMPVMDGLEATRRIRASKVGKPRPWIIALTAGTLEEDRRRAYESGMDDFLTKPLRVEQLQISLARAFEARRPGDSASK